MTEEYAFISALLQMFVHSSHFLTLLFADSMLAKKE